jgi:hypothetical protein
MERNLYSSVLYPEVESSLFTREQIEEITNQISQKIAKDMRKQLEKAFKEYNEKKQKISTDAPKG